MRTPLATNYGEGMSLLFFVGSFWGLICGLWFVILI